MVWKVMVLHQNFLHLGQSFRPGRSFRPWTPEIPLPPRVKINISIFKMTLNRMPMIKTLNDVKMRTRTVAQSKWLPILIV